MSLHPRVASGNGRVSKAKNKKSSQAPPNTLARRRRNAAGLRPTFPGRSFRSTVGAPGSPPPMHPDGATRTTRAPGRTVPPRPPPSGNGTAERAPRSPAPRSAPRSAVCAPGPRTGEAGWGPSDAVPPPHAPGGAGPTTGSRPLRTGSGGHPRPAARSPLTDLERCLRICFLMSPAMVPGGRRVAARRPSASSLPARLLSGRLSPAAGQWPSAAGSPRGSLRPTPRPPPQPPPPLRPVAASIALSPRSPRRTPSWLRHHLRDLEGGRGGASRGGRGEPGRGGACSPGLSRSPSRT